MMGLIKKISNWFKTPTPAYLEIDKAVKEHYEEQDKLDVRALGHGYQPKAKSTSCTLCDNCPRKANTPPKKP